MEYTALSLICPMKVEKRILGLLINSIFNSPILSKNYLRSLLKVR